VTRPTSTSTSTGDDAGRTARIAAAADRLLGHLAPVGELGAIDIADATSVADFLRDLAAADEPAVEIVHPRAESPATDGQLDALSLVSSTVVSTLVGAGFEVTANLDDLERAFFGLASVLHNLGVRVDLDAEPAPGAWLRCIRASSVLRREGAR